MASHQQQQQQQQQSQTGLLSLPVEVRQMIFEELLTTTEYSNDFFNLRLNRALRYMSISGHKSKSGHRVFIAPRIEKIDLAANQVCRVLNKDLNYVLYSTHEVKIGINSAHSGAVLDLSVLSQVVHLAVSIVNMDFAACQKEIEILEAVYARLVRSDKLRTLALNLDNPADPTLKRRWGVGVALELRARKDTMATMTTCGRQLERLRAVIDVLKSGEWAKGFSDVGVTKMNEVGKVSSWHATAQPGDRYSLTEGRPIPRLP